MKLRTRLIITFAAMILLPIFLTAITYILVSSYVFESKPQDFKGNESNSHITSETISGFSALTDNMYQYLKEETTRSDSQIESIMFLNAINEQLVKKYSYIIVMRNGETYYNGSPLEETDILERLPEYNKMPHKSSAGYYHSDIQTYIKYLDYTFEDGTCGSIFLVTKIRGVVTEKLMFDMLVAVVLILLLTSYMLTRWIHKSVFSPIRELSGAMQSIATGNFEHSISTNISGELGDLYKNYEDMRLRLKESTEEKLEVDRHNRELISNISHDLKTPITAVKGYVEGIMDGVADTPEKMDKYVKTIYNKANDMDKLINELTVYAKIDANKIPYNFHKLNVSEYFRDCVEEVGLELEDYNIQLHYSNIVSPDVHVIADPEQLKRVINNIIGNSVKYMDKEEGIIDIQILDELDSVHIEIEDNGCGIEDKNLDNIFKRFYRTDASRNSAQGGSGIGLSIVKKIIEDHGGYIWATSKEREGTCIHFVLKKYKEGMGHE